MNTQVARTVRGLHRSYVLGELLGRGASSEVYRGVALDGQDVFAVKLLASNATQDHAETRLQKEMRILVGLQHPHILTARDIIHSPTVGIATDLIAGPSLDGWLARDGVLGVPEACLLFERLCSALAFAHAQGVIHRDVKPGNVLMRSVDAVDPVLCDFGLARLAVNDVELTAVGKAVGTIDYMSPEQLSGVREVGPAVDVYALGCTLFEALTGAVPFRGTKMEVIRQHLHADPPEVSALRHNLPFDFDVVLQKMLAKNPESRPSLEGVIARLAEIRTSQTVEFDRADLERNLRMDGRLHAMRQKMAEGVSTEKPTRPLRPLVAASTDVTLERPPKLDLADDAPTRPLQRLGEE